MASEQISIFLRRLRHAMAPEGGGLSDAQLLERFVTQRDEAAFETLVWRHGGLVLHVGRRLLHQAQDREDVFQATFLALTHKAGSIDKREALASWLYKVAYRAALRVAVRTAREATGQQNRLALLVSQPADCGIAPEISPMLDAEINRLPEKYRAAVILCYLNGKTTAEAGRLLGCARGTVCSRLAWARRRLRSRLTGRGLTLSTAALGPALPPAAAPARLVATTVRAALSFASQQGTSGALPTRAVALMEGVLRTMFFTKLKFAALGLFVLSMLGLGTGLTTRYVLADKPGGDETPALVRGSGDGLRLPADMPARLHIQATDIGLRPATKARVLRLAGSTALDPDGITRVRSRFAPSEVIEIGKPQGESRSLQSGDKVAKGQLLAVLRSDDVAQAKNDLFSSLVQQKLDEMIQEQAEKSSTAVPQVYELSARRNVQADRNAVARAESRLKSWGIPDKEIETIRNEAREAAKKPKQDTEEKSRTRREQWAQVELRAPADGTIVERNLAPHEIITDGTANLFQIANLDSLIVFANVTEEDLPNLQALPIADRRWTVHAQPGADRTSQVEPIAGAIDDIGYVIDPNQHTAVVKGHIENPGHKLRAGQFVTVSVILPPATGEVWLPATAVVSDAGQNFVFVQPDPKKSLYEQRRVYVVRRGHDAVHVRSRLTPEQERQGFQTLRPGERVITVGALELKAMLDDLKAN